jgi:hypothetical protein
MDKVKKDSGLDIMIDIETMGHVSNSVIVQVGAIVFNPRTGEHVDEFLQNVSIESCLRSGLRVTEGTITWWLGQDKKVSETLFDPKPLELSEVLMNLYKMFMTYAPNRFWAHPNFDPVILENAYLSCGLRVPWTPWIIRCLRTIVDLANPRTKDYSGGMDHNALSDCKKQIAYLMDGLRILEGLKA